MHNYSITKILTKPGQLSTWAASAFPIASMLIHIQSILKTEIQLPALDRVLCTLSLLPVSAVLCCRNNDFPVDSVAVWCSSASSAEISFSVHARHWQQESKKAVEIVYYTCLKLSNDRRNVSKYEHKLILNKNAKNCLRLRFLENCVAKICRPYIVVPGKTTNSQAIKSFFIRRNTIPVPGSFRSFLPAV